MKYVPKNDKSYDCGGPLDGWGISGYWLKVFLEQMNACTVKAMK